MARRIAAGIFTMLLLVTLVLPASATDDTVYPIGYKDMWVVGLETVPTAKTEYPGEWRPVYKADGVTRESQPGKCPLHACDTGCYDIVGNKTCGVAKEDEHSHNIKCAVEATIKYATYRWQVVDPTANDEGNDDEPQETQPVATEPEEDEYTDGSAVLKVYNIDENGVELEGIDFFLLDDTNPDNPIIKGSGKTSSDPGKKGVATIKGLRLPGDAEQATWKLVQDVLPAELENDYLKKEDRWDVTIVRNADGTYSIADVKPEGYDAETPYEDYDKDTGTLTVRNETLRGSIMIDVIFEGFENVLPEGVNATVTITTPDGEELPFEFPQTAARFYLQQAQLPGLKMGTYSIKASAPAELDGYTAEGPIIQLQSPVDGIPNGNTSVKLSGAVGYYTAAKFTVTYRYTKTCDHSYTETVVPPTCTQDGSTIFTCSECGDSYTEPGGQATGHEYEPKVTAPTCTTPGYTTFSCVNPGCTHSYVEDGDPATGHNYDVKNVTPTCEEKGYTVYTCLNEGCTHSYQDSEVEATGHNYKDEVVLPTCTEKGYTKHTCTNEGCAHSYQDSEVEATGHNYKDEVVLPTCTEKGYTKHTCTNEGCTHSYQDNEVGATGHNYKNGVCSCGAKDPDAEKPTETKPSAGAVKQSNVVIVRVVDDLGNQLQNVQIGLYDDKEAVRTWSATYDNVFVPDDLENLLTSGDSVTYTLKQTKGSAGHSLAAESYNVTISKTGGKVRVDVKKNAGSLSNMFKGSGVEMGTDGKQIVTFINQRKTTQIELNCETFVEFANGIWQDEALFKECKDASYQLLLKWEDAKGNAQEETVTVTNDSLVQLEAEIPYGTDYELSVLDGINNCRITLSENCKGTVDAEQVKEIITVKATREYSIEPGNSPEVHFAKVDAETKRPLQNVEFTLKNEKGVELANYISAEDGTFVIRDVLKEPGRYTLHETQTVDGYQILTTPVQINVTVQYDRDSEFKIIQNMEAEIVSNAVVEESDGSFWIENNLMPVNSDAEESGGLGAGAIIGICVAGAAALGGIGFVLYRKKRKVV